MGHAKKEELDSLNKNELVAEAEAKEKKREHCSFFERISETRLKGVQKKDLIKYCINTEEPEITALFDRLDANNDQL